MIPVDIDPDNPSDAAAELADARAAFLLAQERLHRAVINAAQHHELRGQLTDDSNLTAREIDIINAVANGADNRQIADRFFISMNTVKTNVRTAYRRMGVATRAEAVKWTIRRGLDAPELPGVVVSSTFGRSFELPPVARGGDLSEEPAGTVSIPPDPSSPPPAPQAG